MLVEQAAGEAAISIPNSSSPELDLPALGEHVPEAGVASPSKAPTHKWVNKLFTVYCTLIAYIIYPFPSRAAPHTPSAPTPMAAIEGGIRCACLGWFVFTVV